MVIFHNVKENIPYRLGVFARDDGFNLHFHFHFVPTVPTLPSSLKTEEEIEWMLLSQLRNIKRLEVLSFEAAMTLSFSEDSIRGRAVHYCEI